MCSATPTTSGAARVETPTRVWAADRPLADAVLAGKTNARTAARTAKRRTAQRLLNVLVLVVVVTG